MADARTTTRLAWVRARWRAPDAAAIRARAAARLDAWPDDPTADTWRAILAGRHPFVRWLDSDEPVPDVLDDGTETRRLLASHPFVQDTPWSTPTTSPTSSSTPRG